MEGKPQNRMQDVSADEIGPIGNPSLCPSLWDFTDRKEFHKRGKFAE